MTDWKECAALEELPDPATYPRDTVKVAVHAPPVCFVHRNIRTLYKRKKGCVILGRPYYVFGWAEGEAAKP